MKNNICNIAYPAELVKFLYGKEQTSIIFFKNGPLSFLHSYRKWLCQSMTIPAWKESTFYL